MAVGVSNGGVAAWELCHQLGRERQVESSTMVLLSSCPSAIQQTEQWPASWTVMGLAHSFSVVTRRAHAKSMDRGPSNAFYVSDLCNQGRHGRAA